MTLRSALTRLVLAVVAIALSAAVALVAITALLHRTTARLGQAMENAQLADQRWPARIGAGGATRGEPATPGTSGRAGA